jgi:hypothetical protein
MWWMVVAVLTGIAAGLAVAAFRRDTASTATLDVRAGQYLAGAFALVAVAWIIFLSKFA